MRESAHALLHCFLVGIDDDIGVFRRFIGVGDAGEVGDLAAQRFLIEPFDIAARQFSIGQRT